MAELIGLQPFACQSHTMKIAQHVLGVTVRTRGQVSYSGSGLVVTVNRVRSRDVPLASHRVSGCRLPRHLALGSGRAELSRSGQIGRRDNGPALTGFPGGSQKRRSMRSRAGHHQRRGGYARLSRRASRYHLADRASRLTACSALRNPAGAIDVDALAVDCESAK